MHWCAMDHHPVHYEGEPSPGDERCPVCLEIGKAVAAERKVEDLQAQLDGRRMCLTCGERAPVGVDQHYINPACVSAEHDGYAPCLFDATPEEAWQYWSQKAHEAEARASALMDELEEERLRSQQHEADLARLRNGMRELADWTYAGGDAEPFFRLQQAIYNLVNFKRTFNG